MKPKKKKLSLAKTWKECLKMWKWIVEHLDDYEDGVDNLKTIYEDEHDLDIHNGCFFCDYTTTWDEEWEAWEEDCSKCPGRLVSSRFSCEHDTYNFLYEPKKFYKRLLKLNKKRLEKK